MGLGCGVVKRFVSDVVIPSSEVDLSYLLLDATLSSFGGLMNLNHVWNREISQSMLNQDAISISNSSTASTDGNSLLYMQSFLQRAH